MNAIEIIERVRACNAELVVDDDRLLVRGRGDPLPAELVQELREHKLELMLALGAPFNRTVGGILREIRPYLPVSLRRLPDDRLLVLVNWSIIAAFEKSVREFSEQRTR